MWTPQTEEEMLRFIAEKEDEVAAARERLEDLRREEATRKDQALLRLPPDIRQVSDAELGAIARRIKLGALLDVLRNGLNFHPNENVLGVMQAGGIFSLGEVAYALDLSNKKKAGQDGPAS